MVAILGYSKDQITGAVQAMYGQVAASPTQYFHFPVGRPAALALGYPEAELDALPDAAVASFAGVGYPFRADAIKSGDIVLDIGAGSGTDTLIANRRVGESGKVYALDITPGMVAKLKTTLEAAGTHNVEVIEADAERIPLPDNSVDVVTSNGALNLVPDKRRAFAEIFRVLRPEGRVQLADIVIAKPVPLGGRSDPKLWAECVVGASIDEDYLALFRESGFADLEVLREFDYFAESPSADTRRIAAGLGARAIEVTMRRPVEAAAPGIVTRLAHRLHPRRLKRIGERGLWGAVGAVTAIVACWGVLVLLGVLSLLGISLALNETAWALTVVAAAFLAVVATGFNLRRHGQPWPLLMAGIGAAIIFYTSLVSYSLLIEGLGFAVILGAVALDLYRVYLAECVPRRPDAESETVSATAALYAKDQRAVR